jgi:hypothetical protein
MNRAGYRAVPEIPNFPGRSSPAGKSRIAEIQKRLPSMMPLYAKVKDMPYSSLLPYRSNVDGVAPIYR